MTDVFERPFASEWRRRRLTPEERVARGRAARAVARRSSHGAWAPPAGRADPVALLARQDADRVPERRMIFDLNDFDETYPGP